MRLRLKLVADVDESVPTADNSSIHVCDSAWSPSQADFVVYRLLRSHPEKRLDVLKYGDVVNSKSLLQPSVMVVENESLCRTKNLTLHDLGGRRRSLSIDLSFQTDEPNLLLLRNVNFWKPSLCPRWRRHLANGVHTEALRGWTAKYHVTLLGNSSYFRFVR